MSSQNHVPNDRNTGRKLSRRELLKLTGIASLGAVAGKISLPTSIVNAERSSQEELRRFRNIVHNSYLYRVALDELNESTLEFDLDNGILLQRYQKSPNIVGVTLNNVRSGAYSPTGANLSLTVDLDTSALYAVQYVIGTSEAEGLHIKNTLLRLPESATDELMRVDNVEFYERDEKQILSNKESTDTLYADSPDGCNYLYTSTECDSWQYAGCCGNAWCFCQSPPAGQVLMCVCYKESRWCRDCTHYANCPTSCGIWTQQFRNNNVGCPSYC